MVILHYQGHGSFRLTSGDTVIYVDPYAGTGYDVPADLILVSHEHGDHNQVGLCARKNGCEVFRAADFIAGNGRYNTLERAGAKITGFPAENKNHPRASCVGFVIELGGVKLYAACDTSRVPEMKELEGVDCALFPIDGVYNMGADEASLAAEDVGAKVSIPVHMSPGKLFDRAAAERFHADGRVILADGEEITIGK